MLTILNLFIKRDLISGNSCKKNQSNIDFAEKSRIFVKICHDIYGQ